jgi:dolichol-phosphate mannosyltransferase
MSQPAPEHALPLPVTPATAPSPRVLVSVATYNEIDNLPLLVEAIWQAIPSADILVIDDNSPDGTGQWCDQRAATDRRLRCLHRPGKLGLGTATLAAFAEAIEHGYDYLVNLDADFSHPPDRIPALVAAMEHADVAIGSRYCPGGRTEGWPRRRKLMSWAVNTYARWLLGLAPRDTSGAFRCYRVALLKKLDPASIVSRGYSFQEEVLWRLKRLGARFVEVPITFVERQRGQSKIDRQEAWQAIRILFRLGLTHWLGR